VFKTSIQKIICAAAFVPVVLFHATQAAAQTIIGTGTLSCGKWLEARERRNELQTDLYVQWIWGYLAAHDYYRAPGASLINSRMPDQATVTAFVNQFCRDNPLTFVVDASAELVQELGGARVFHNEGKPPKGKR
jgi:hypothetical protein